MLKKTGEREKSVGTLKKNKKGVSLRVDILFSMYINFFFKYNLVQEKLKSPIPKYPKSLERVRDFWMLDQSCPVCYECDVHFRSPFLIIAGFVVKCSVRNALPILFHLHRMKQRIVMRIRQGSGFVIAATNIGSRE